MTQAGTHAVHLSAVVRFYSVFQVNLSYLYMTRVSQHFTALHERRRTSILDAKVAHPPSTHKRSPQRKVEHA